MAVDLQHRLGATVRSVETMERDGKPARGVTLERAYDTTPDDLWDAVTNAERLPRWFLPVSGELRLGGRYQLEGNAGGTVTACDPPRTFSITWEFGGGMSWVDVRIAPEGDARAMLTLRHVCPVDEFWEQFGPGAAGVGWDLGLLGLALHLDGGTKDDFDEDAFFKSDEGRTVVAMVSDDWARAAVAAGEAPAQAEAAAQRTTAFYTGAPPPEG